MSEEPTHECAGVVVEGTEERPCGRRIFLWHEKCIMCEISEARAIRAREVRRR